MAERRDLTELEYFFGTSLSEGLSARNIKRVAEVGIGSVGFSIDLSAIRQLIHLESEGVPLFKAEDILGVDPELPDRDMLNAYADPEFFRRFRAEKMSSADLAAKVRTGQEDPFDLVICKGVVSVGLLYLQHGGDFRGMRTSARNILQDL